MTLGLTLVFLTGLSWIGVGIVFSLAVKRQADFASFMFVQSAISTLAAFIILPNHNMSTWNTQGRMMALAVVMSMVAILGAAGFGAMKKAMETGRHGIVWTIAQSSMLLPFVAAMLLWREAPGIVKCLGMLLLLSSLPLCSSKNGAGTESKVWIPFALAAFALIGAGQVVSIIPSHWEGWSDKANLRIPLLFLASSVIWLAVAAIRKGRVELAQSWRGASAYAVVVLLGQFFLYKSLDAMSAIGMSGLVYPLAIGLCIGGFLLYSIVVLKERLNFTNGLGVSCAIAGVIALTIN